MAQLLKSQINDDEEEEDDNSDVVINKSTDNWLKKIELF